MTFAQEDREYEAYINWLSSEDCPEGTDEEIEDAWDDHVADIREQHAEHLMSFWMED